MKSNIIRLIALLAVASVVQLTVSAGAPLLGKLRTRNNKPVTVNGAKLSSGASIRSGTQIQCPEKIGATVDLGNVGRLDIAPQSDVTVIFDATKISVQLKAGYVVLTTNQGVTGTVSTPEGQVFGTDSSKLSSVVGKTAGAVGPETGVPIGAGLSSVGLSPVVGVAGAAGAVVGGTTGTALGRTSDVSTDNPRAPEE